MVAILSCSPDVDYKPSPLHGGDSAIGRLQKIARKEDMLWCSSKEVKRTQRFWQDQQVFPKNVLSLKKKKNRHPTHLRTLNCNIFHMYSWVWLFIFFPRFSYPLSLGKKS